MQRLKGFSLIELVITLAVVAILSGMVLTFSSAFLQDNRIETANNDLIGSINLARSTAVSRGEPASICASSNGTSCTNTTWEQGWIVFSDTGVAGIVDGNDQILKISKNAGVNITVTNLASYLQFKSQGFVASTCVNCYDKTLGQRLNTIFARVTRYLSPISLAHAADSSDDSNTDSSKNDVDSSSDDSDSEGGSGRSGSSSSKTPLVSCVAPASSANRGGSGSSGSSSDDSDSDSDSTSAGKYNKYSDYAFNFLAQVSPISLAQAEGNSDDSSADTSKSDDDSSDDSSDSGSSGSNNTNTGVAATCDDGSGKGQVALSKSQFLICDDSMNSENGSRISVLATGRVSRSKVACN